MTRQKCLRSTLIAVLFIVIITNPLVVFGQRAAASYLRPEHRAIVEQWLKLRSELRLATDADNTNKEGLAATRKEQGRNYHPYYAVGDFNGDGKEDFAVAFIKTRKSKSPFTVAIFNGPLVGNSVPAFTTDDDLRSGGIFYKPKAKPKEGRLIVGIFESDDCVILRPRGKTYVLKDCLSE
ncbi:MAG: FG-GAP repeat protein [Acidobacteriota bacterium]|nr:FG-GAP repeat protein [Acidobacteriota bacterium]